MKHESEIARNHDLLGNILNGHVPVDIDDETRQVTKIVQMTLCWALDHGHYGGKEIGRFLRHIAQEVRDAGYVLPNQNLPHSN